MGKESPIHGSVGDQTSPPTLEKGGSLDIMAALVFELPVMLMH